MAQQAGRWPELDGLRAIAVLAVLAWHLQAPGVRGGSLGVDVFFVLSGFLITTLLFGEMTASRKIDLRAFYVRRALRLFPALLIAVTLATILAFTTATRYKAATLHGLPWVLFYVGNVSFAFGHGTLGLLGNTWSLAEEEQFYLLWPAACFVILYFTVHRSWLSPILLICAVTDFAWQEFLAFKGASFERLAFAPDCRFGPLLLGCSAAFLFSSRFYSRLRKRVSAHVYSSAAFVALVGTIAVIMVFPMSGTGKWIPIGSLLGSALTAILIVAVVDCKDGLASRALSSRSARWIGARSYGLYLYHFVVIMGFPLPGTSHFVRLPVHLGLSFLLTAASYRLVEQRALGLKRKWTRGRELGISIEADRKGGTSKARTEL